MIYVKAFDKNMNQVNVELSFEKGQYHLLCGTRAMEKGAMIGYMATVDQIEIERHNVYQMGVTKELDYAKFERLILANIGNKKWGFCKIPNAWDDPVTMLVILQAPANYELMDDHKVWNLGEANGLYCYAVFEDTTLYVQDYALVCQPLAAYVTIQKGAMRTESDK